MKTYREELIDKLDVLAKESKEKKEINASVVLHVLIGAMYGNSDHLLATICKDFAQKEKERIISGRN